MSVDPTQPEAVETGHPSDSATSPEAARRARLALGALVGWTLFVWIGRVRNALSDPELEGAQKLGPLVLSLSFLLPALALGVAWVSARRRGGRVDRWASVLIRVFAAWTIAVWVLRVADIALGGDWSPGFIAVHAVLGAVSVALAIAAVLTDRTVSSGMSAPEH